LTTTTVKVVIDSGPSWIPTLTALATLTLTVATFAYVVLTARLARAAATANKNARAALSVARRSSADVGAPVHTLALMHLATADELLLSIKVHGAYPAIVEFAVPSYLEMVPGAAPRLLNPGAPETFRVLKAHTPPPSDPAFIVTVRDLRGSVLDSYRVDASLDSRTIAHILPLTYSRSYLDEVEQERAEDSPNRQ